MRKTTKILLMFILLFNIVACTTKEKEHDPKPIPPVVQKESTEIKKLKWVENEYTKTIPKFTAGKNQEVYTNSEEGFVFGSYEVTEEDYETYLVDVKSMGYTKGITEVNSSYKSFTASNGTYQLTIGYSDGYISITIIKAAI